MNITKRELWVDYVKVLACILVVLGHFFQSLVKANILSNNDLYQYFDKTIYYFHVPLFFICSGYLYQKLSHVYNFKSWKDNIIKKLIVLGIPYVVFSSITWVMKVMFSGSVNGQIENGIIHTLFFRPIGMYWYLYCLFFCFFITFTLNNKRTLFVVLTIAILGKVMSIIGITCPIFAVSSIMNNEIWFVLGMLMCANYRKIVCHLKAKYGYYLLLIFLIVSFVIKNINSTGISFAMGLLACFAIVDICFFKVKHGNRVINWCIQYTLPIYLMHTIAASCVRILLLKLQIANGVVHVLFGLIASFGLPIVAAIIMEKTKWLEIFLYPNKVIKKLKVKR